MIEKTKPQLDGVSETLLFPLVTRAVESQRPDALIKDDQALRIVEQLDCDISRYRLRGHDEVSLILRLREFDRMVRDFLRRNPQAVIVHIGCGLDTRFDRVDNGQVEWFDLDLPQVIELRKKLISAEQPRYHLLSGSVFEGSWQNAVNAYRQLPFLFISEAVLPYFENEQVKSLVLSLREHFPGAELVCDVHSPFIIWADNLHLALAGTGARMQWKMKHAKDMEGWGDGITLLEEWYYFDRPEPRLEPYRWMRFIKLLGKSTGIFRYRMGERS